MELLSVSSPGLAVPDFPCSDDLQALVGFLEPPASPGPLGGLKFPLQGDDGYLSASVYPQYPFDQEGLYDWMAQEALLPSPEEQEADLMYLPPSEPVPYPPFSLLTPDSSSPSTPASFQDPEVLDALSLISPTQLGQPSHVLPQFDTHSPIPSPASSFNPHPFSVSPCDPGHISLLSSPLSAQEFSPYSATADPPLSPATPEIIDLTADKTEGIRDLLSKDSEEDTRKITSRKRKFEPEVSGVGKGKRRRLSKTAKKERKREQNKQAALRYRQRKRGEVEIVDEKMEELEALNSDLKREVKALSTEISYLKNLWREVETARARRSAETL